MSSVIVSDRKPSGQPVHSSQASDDQHLLRLWLHGKSPRSQEAYRRDVLQFLQFVAVAISAVKLQHLQDWANHLSFIGLKPSTQARKLAAVKSLFSFGHRVGYLSFNIGAALSTPKVPDQLADRILSEADVQRMLVLETNTRNAVLLRLFYASGGRVSELAALYWKSLHARDNIEGQYAGQVTLLGKGSKTRSILLSKATWDVIVDYRNIEKSNGYGCIEDPVFRSRKGGPLSRQQIWRIVKRAAERSGLSEYVSPHWLRHAHASHALDRGAPTHLVKETLGHKSLATTSKYTHARPDDSSARYLSI